MAEATFAAPYALPVGARARNSTGWWGVLCLIATEGSLFAYLLFSYAYIAIERGARWLPDRHPSILLSGPNTLLLLLSSVAAWWGEGGVKRGQRRRLLAGLALAAALGVVFIIVQGFEWRSKPYGISSGSYGSLFFTITGFHMAHVIVGVAILTVVLAWSGMGYFHPRRHSPVSVAVIYWHFVDAVWLCVFTTFYLTPYLE